ncbi:hypothetical protein CU098_004670 [Rhizopus stolonifer]|uniref:Reverse transcriptase domain-containing protein n=1 Tax=Rhizopus stolonifer TaxID=4846 RepID=A0A367JK43_RHIST|nr:hypothetical protein CU098_004670 [Rhizopus stolonifer]
MALTTTTMKYSQKIAKTAATKIGRQQASMAPLVFPILSFQMLRRELQCETSADYLKETIESKSIKKSMSLLIYPITNNLCQSTEEMEDAVSKFYVQFYCPDQVRMKRIADLTSKSIPGIIYNILCIPLTLTKLQDGVARTSNQSSPGIDGLPYEPLPILLQHSLTGALAIKVYNDALTSWLQTCMTLLPKKGNLALLAN